MARLRGLAPPLRLIAKGVRFEAFTLLAATVAGAVGMVVLAGWIDRATEAAARCTSHACLAQDELGRLQIWAQGGAVITMILPIVAGVILGGPLVAAEIERRTAALAWSIAPSRMRWLAERLVVLGALVVLVSLVLSVGHQILLAAEYPGADLGRSFVAYESRPPLIVARALLAFGVAVLVGSMTGRVLPAILLAAVLALALLAGLRVGFDALNRAEAVELPLDAGGGLITSAILRDPATGQELTPDQIGSEAVEVVPFGLPGARAGVVVARESGLEASLGLAAAGAASIVVTWRRPL